MQKLTRTCYIGNLHCCHYLLSSVCSPSLGQLISIDFMYQLLFLFMLNNVASHLLLSERESGYIHARNCVCLSKNENSSFYLELVSHRMPECVNELSTFSQNKTPTSFS